MENNREASLDGHIYGQVIFNKWTKIIMQWGKKSFGFQQILLEQMYIHTKKHELHSYLTSYIENIQDRS